MVNWWTEYKYWHLDSIVKQTIMMADKSGLRDKKAFQKNTIGKREIERQKEEISKRDLNLFLSQFNIGGSNPPQKNV